jgi:hypothetical protein
MSLVDDVNRAAATELYRARLERIACAIASAWYGVMAPPMQGLQDYGENPRAEPEKLVASAIMVHAIALMQEIDEAAAELAIEGYPVPPPPMVLTGEQAAAMGVVSGEQAAALGVEVASDVVIR